MTLSAGARLGPYEILSPLGAGGMGEVYKAHDSKLGREVAIKVLPESLAEDADALSRFEREAKAVAALNHPNILSIHDFGNENGTPYAVMELLEGQTLREKLLTGALPQRKVVDYAIQIAHGLAAAHEKGIIHRDLKPDNIFLTKEGRVKILDFGLAKQSFSEISGGQSHSPTVSAYTEPGAILGTVGYMSPEQVRGKPLDVRSDIFSFGSVLYEMLTGERAFRRDTAAETMTAILRDEPPEPLGEGKKIPLAADRIVRHCLEKNPAERFHSAHDLAYALGEIGPSSEVTTGSSAGVWVRRRGAWGAAAFVLLAIGVAAWLLVGRKSGRGLPNSAFSTAAPATRGTTTTVTMTPAKSVAVLPFENLSPDKNNAYFADGMQDMILTKLAGIKDLKVISRTSTEKYKSHPDDLKTIARQLGVATILEGSVQKSGNQVLINVQLIDVGSNAHLWANAYQRTLANVFGVEGEVAQDVAEALQAKLLPVESARLANIPTKNPRAWDLYLKAMYFLSQVETASARDPAEVGHTAAALLNAAVVADPDFALAYAKLSYLESFSYWYGIDTSAYALQTASGAAQRALELQPDLPEAHLAMGYFYYWGHRDYASALAEFGKARTNLPNSVQVLEAIAYIHRRQGEISQAVEELQHAETVDPRDSTVPREIGNTLLLLRRFSQAQTAYQRALVLVPDDADALVGEATVLMMSGDLQSAGGILAAIPPDNDPQGSISLARFQLALLMRQPDTALAAITHAPSWITSRFEHCRIPIQLLRGEALMMKGDSVRARAAFLEARQSLEGQLGKPREGADAASYLAIVYLGLGQTSRALESGRDATAGVPLSRDVIVGAFYLARLAKIEAHAGQTPSALGHIEMLLAAPAGQILSTAVLQIDPAWDPIRHDPRFHELLKKYGTPPVDETR